MFRRGYRSLFTRLMETGQSAFVCWGSLLSTRMSMGIHRNMLLSAGFAVKKDREVTMYRPVCSGRNC